MSTSLAYHAFGATTYNYRTTKYEGGAILIHLEKKQFWSQQSKEDAEDFIKQWVAEAMALKNGHVTRFAKTIQKRIEGILGWYDHKITTGPLECFNNKIKVFKRAAYGYRDADFFGLRILFLHETGFKINGS